jgi:putative acyl-CoA dehydrogenase
MTTLDPFGYATHDVVNQAPALADYNAYSHDPALAKILAIYGADWFASRANAIGKSVGSARVQELARQANRNLPDLRTHDRWGRRVDQIEFHPAWHELMSLGMRDEFHCLCWNEPRAGAQVARAAISYLWNQGENGICCPLSMTYSAIPLLRRDPTRWADYGRLVSSTDYDGRPLPAAQKRGGTVGMAMTEKQGGSDLRQTQTTAERNSDGTYSLIGHKWFFSVPQSDLFFTLARTREGISCFVVPGWLPDGSRNRLQIQRLKDKCGNKSNASSEVEFRGVIAYLIGEPGHGIREGLEMNHYTRLDFGVGSAGLMRHALAQAAHHVTWRRVFQKALIDQPLMTNVIADLAIEVEAVAWLAFRIVHALDQERESEAERLFGRIGAPIAKYWICKRAVPVVAEALECHGGNGFIEDHPMARLYREAPSTASGKAQAMSFASTCCARSGATLRACPRSSTNCDRPKAAIRATTPSSLSSKKIWLMSFAPKARRAASSSGSRSRFRPRYLFVMPRTTSPTPSWCRAWQAHGRAISAR